MLTEINLALFYAVDFDRLIIHSTAYTWDEWCTVGKRTYPTCEPIRAEYLETYRREFEEFTDMR